MAQGQRQEKEVGVTNKSWSTVGEVVREYLRRRETGEEFGLELSYKIDLIWDWLERELKIEMPRVADLETAREILGQINPVVLGLEIGELINEEWKPESTTAENMIELVRKYEEHQQEIVRGEVGTKQARGDKFNVRGAIKKQKELAALAYLKEKGVGAREAVDTVARVFGVEVEEVQAIVKEEEKLVEEVMKKVGGVRREEVEIAVVAAMEIEVETGIDLTPEAEVEIAKAIVMGDPVPVGGEEVVEIVERVKTEIKLTRLANNLAESMVEANNEMFGIKKGENKQETLFWVSKEVQRGIIGGGIEEKEVEIMTGGKLNKEEAKILLAKTETAIRKSQRGEMGSREIKVVLEKFISQIGNMPEVVQIRANLIKSEVVETLKQKVGIYKSVEQKVAAQKMGQIVAKIYVDGGRQAREIEKNKIEIIVTAVKEGARPGMAEAEFEKVPTLVGMLHQDPQATPDIVKTWVESKKLIGAVDLASSKLEKLAALDGVMEWAGKSEANMKLLQTAQRWVGVWDKMNNIGGWMAGKLGMEEAAKTWLTKIGGQQATDFAVNALKFISESGSTELGIKNLLSALVKSLGTKAVAGEAAGAAGGAAASGTLAATVAAFQAIPIAGQIALVVVVAAVGAKYLWDKIQASIRPIKRAIGSVLGALGIDIESMGLWSGVKRDLAEAMPGWMGRTAGKVVEFAGNMMIGIGAVLAAPVGPIIVLVLLGVTIGAPLVNMFTGNQMSMQVAPLSGTGGGEQIAVGPGMDTGQSVSPIPVPTWNPNIPIPEGCPNTWPVPDSNRITQGYGNNGCSHQNMTNAIDIGANNGTPIVAAHSGLMRAGANAIYGNYLEIVGVCNGNTFTTRYAHLPDLPLAPGETREVEAGEQIGVVNNTGSSTGPHLHFDIRDGNPGLPIESYFGLPSLVGCCVDGTSCPQRTE